MDEEVVLLEEQVMALQADVENLQSRLADSEALAAGRDADIARLRSELSERDALIAGHAADAEARRVIAEAAEEGRRDATVRYRELVLDHEPDLPADLVSGDTVQEIDAAVARARETVSQVRQRFEAAAQASRVPAGAPPRGGIDTSSMTPAEKIRLGLQQGH